MNKELKKRRRIFFLLTKAQSRLKLIDRVYAADRIEPTIQNRKKDEILHLINELTWSPDQVDLNSAHAQIGMSQTNTEFLEDLRLPKPQNVERPQWQKNVLEALASSTKDSHARMQAYRIGQQTLLANKEGWYVVFDSLTLRDQRQAHEAFTEGWRRYKQNIQSQIAIAVYGSTREAKKHKTTDYVHHFNVIEKGTLRGRPHMHTMWYFRDVPKHWKGDPNKKRKIPNYREIDGMKPLWPYGIATPTAFRTHGDAWAKRSNWKWPVDKNGQPLKVEPPERAGGYMIKYLTKDRYKDKEGNRWRTRISRGLGKQEITRTMSLLPLRLLRPLSKLRSRRIECGLPSTLQRSAAAHERFQRALECPNWRTLLRMTHSRTSTNVTTFFQRVGDSPTAAKVACEVLLLFAQWTAAGGQYKRREEAYQFIENYYPKPLRTPKIAGVP